MRGVKKAAADGSRVDLASLIAERRMMWTGSFLHGFVVFPLV